MCMFSRFVEHVSATKIFARELADGRQVLVYAMDFAAADELAMVLPLPVPVRCGDHAIEFVDLEGYGELFDDLRRVFPAVGAAQSKSRGAWGKLAIKPLRVHRVGSFDASFVPHPRDFDRLDARFRLAPEVIAALPAYADWGFAVFQLRRSRKPSSVHPMALRFPSREPGALFFPTVHVHDGSVPEAASFDHTLYAQLSPILGALVDWTPSTAALGTVVDDARAKQLVDGRAGGWSTSIAGMEPNRDVWLRPPSGIAEHDLAGGGPTYAYRIRATYHFARHSHDQYPQWRETSANRLPALCAGVKRGLAELTTTNASAWQLAPLHDALPPHFMNGSQLWRGTTYFDGTATLVPGPGRITFRPFTDRVEPQEIKLGFSELPEQEAATRIDRALRAMLDRAVA